MSEWTLQEDLSIGSVEGLVVFGSVSSLLGLPDGGVLVKDAQGPRVLRFSSTGTLLFGLGGVGDGPGEFRDICGLAYLPDGSFLLRDGRKGLLVFGPDGSLTSEQRTPGGYLGNDAVSFSDGQVLIRDPVRSPGIEGFWTERQQRFIRVRLGSSVIDTLVLPGPPDLSTLSWAPYHSRFHVEWLSDGSFVQGPGSQGRLTLVGSNGPTVIPLSNPPRRLPLPDWARSEIEDHRAWLEQRGDRSAPYYPETPVDLPVFSRILVSSEDEIWIQRPVSAVEGRLWYRMDVFDRSGSLVGVLPIPLGLDVRSVVGDSLWGVRKGEFDEDYVVRFRVLRSPAPPS